MKKTFSKLTSLALTAIMLTSSLAIAPTSVFAAPTISAGGWNETLYANLSGVSDSQVTGVSYSGTMNGSLTGEDFEYLVRDENGGVRIDIPGLKAGTYTLNVYTSAGNVTASDVVVPEQDRSGYAHYGYNNEVGKSGGIGAYNNDGTLKSNARVIYVTNANKDTVTISSNDGTTVRGIGHILNSAGKTAKVSGALVNNNRDIIKKLAEDGTPLVVRFIGSVEAPTGLTAYDSADYGGSVGDNGFMARMQSGRDITLEGIGHDAQINGWGVHFIAESATTAKGFGQSFEVRNLEFWGSPEDSIGVEGQQSGTTISAPVKYIWVHNNSFLPQKISNPAESDKAEGDGCCDYKRGYYMTMSYNYFKKAHKTSLIGSSDTSLQFHVTWHHNMWEDCEARGPLGRQANVHIYNNYYLRQSDYAMNTRANCYIFSEYNTMEYCKNPMRVDAGAIKSYNDVLVCCSGAQGGTVVANKTDKVSTSNQYANFDTDSSVSYIPTGDYNLDESAAAAKAKILAYAGPMKENVVTEDSVSTSILPSDFVPTAHVNLPYSKSFGTTNFPEITAAGKTVIDNVIYNPSKKPGGTEMVIKDNGIVFSVGQKATVNMTHVSATGTAALMSDTGVTYISGTGSATIEPGTYVIQSDYYDAGSGQFKEAKIASLEIKAFDPNESTTAKPEVPTETTTATTKPESSSTTTTEKQEENPTETTTEYAPDGGVAAMGTYVIGTGATGGDYNVTAKTATKGNVAFSLRAISADGGSLRAGDDSNIAFILDKTTKVAVTVAGRDATVTNATTFAVISTLPKGATTELTLDASSYIIEGADSGSNTKISKLVLTAVEGGSTVEPTPTPTPDPETYTITVGSGEAKVGEKITMAVKLEKAAVIGGYKGQLTYDNTVLTLDSLTNPYTSIVLDYNDNNGAVDVAAVNGDDVSTDILFNLEFTANKASEGSEVKLTFESIFDGDAADITPTINNGKAVVTEETTVVTGLKGDVDLDTKVDKADAALLLKHIAGSTKLTAEQLKNADCDGSGAVDMRDVTYILGMEGVTVALTNGTTYSPATILGDGTRFVLTQNATSTANQVKVKTGRLFFKLNEGDTIVVTYKCGSSSGDKKAGLVIDGSKSDQVAAGAGNQTFEFKAPATAAYDISADLTGDTSVQIVSIAVK